MLQNKFLGLPAGPPVQRSLHSLFSQQAMAGVQNGHASGSDDEPPSKKRRVIDDSDEDMDEDKKVNKSPVSAKKPVAKAKTPVASTSKKPAAAEPKKVAPIFAAAAASKSANGKGKAPAKAKDEDDDDGKVAHSSSGESGSEGESDGEIDDADESQAAVKMAEIFQRKQIGASKGTGGAGPTWKEGESVPYAALVHCFVQIDGTSKRTEILTFLTTFLTSVIERTPKDLLKTTYLCINRICPDYEGLELGIGEGLLVKAIAASMGKQVAGIKSELEKVGDLGLIAKNSRQAQKTLSFAKPKPLTIDYVFNQLKNIAVVKGNKSQDAKIKIIQRLLSEAAAGSEEPKYIVRSLEGKLRIGLAEKTVLVALGHAVVQAEISKSGKRKPVSKLTEELETAANTVKAVFSELPSYDAMIPALLEHGIDGLQEACQLTPGVPLKPMLAKPTKAITEVLTRFEGRNFTCEYKYDGERAQVHILEDGGVRVFSRNSEDMSAKYPDLVVSVPKALGEGTKSAILDSEAVAWDLETKRILPFQELSRRKRKDVKVEDIKVRVKLYGFDLLYLNGENLLHRDLGERRELLRKHFVESEDEFGYAISRDADTSEAIQEFLDESIKDSCEGLMVKMLEGEGSTYEPSKRSMNWLKVKKDYLAGVGDTFDLVVIGAYPGQGKRTGTYGAFLLASYDSESERFQAICKLGTGFSDVFLDEAYAKMRPLETSARGEYDLGGAKPAVVFKPEVVWEVACADLSLSPIYTSAAGKVGDGSRGISLRFPRYIRTRDDKAVEDATDADQVAEAYERQAVAGGGGGGGPGGAKRRRVVEEGLYDD